MNRTMKFLLGAATVAAFFAGGWWWAMPEPTHKHELVRKETAQGQTYWTCAMHPEVRTDEPGNCPICGMMLVERDDAPPQHREVRYWYDPMRPDVHFDAPGKSPFMDMELVPKYSEDGAPDAVTVRIDPGMVQNLGIRTAPVRRGPFEQRIEAVGNVEPDGRLIYAVQSRAAGWVERLDVGATGDPVRRGQTVAGVYAPKLFSAQQELVLAVRSGDPDLVAAARQRLVLLGIGPRQIEDILRDGEAQRQARILAPSDGVVTELHVRQGQQVPPGTPLMQIADLSRVWITIEVPESQSAWVRAGQPATARLPAWPDRPFPGEVEYVYPHLDRSTRTVQARLTFQNDEGHFKPGMFARVSLSTGPRGNFLRVPTESVIRTGRRTVVIVAADKGHFRPTAVEAGAEQGGETVILSGLEDGQSVVVSGQFLIDSEASLLGAYSRMDPDGEGAGTVP